MAMRRPGKGSTKPANVKLRPAPAEAERAKPRRKGYDVNNPPVIPRTEFEDDDDEDADFGLNSKGKQVDRTYNETATEKRPLEGVLVCTTGRLGINKEDVRRICTALGAQFVTSLRLDTTLLIADSATGDKYHAAIENRIPVLRSTFLSRLHEAWINAESEIDMHTLSDEERLPPLHGLCICLTGYDTSSEQGARLRETIATAGGADYSPSLDHTVTHLVVGPKYSSINDVEDNGKFTSATKINRNRIAKARLSKSAGPGDVPAESHLPPIHIVWSDWLETSLVVYGRLREETYDVQLVAERDLLPPNRVQRTMDVMDRISNLPHLQRKTGSSKIGRDDSAIFPEFMEMSTRKRERENTNDDLQSVSKHSRLDASTSVVKVSRSGEAGNADDDAPEPVAMRKERARSLAPTSTISSRPPLGKARSSAQLEIRALNDLLSPALPLSKDLPFNESGTNSLKHDKGKAVLKPHADTHLPAAIDSAIASTTTSTSLLTKMSKDRSSKFALGSNLVTPISVNMSRSISSGSGYSASEFPASLISAEPKPERLPPIPSSDGASAAPSRIFEGRKLLLVFPGLASSRLAVIRGHIEERGGSVADTDGPDVDWVVCKTIAAHKPEYDVADERIVTDSWLERCLCADELVSFDDPIFWMKQPVRLQLPIQGIEAFSACYAGFDETARMLVEKFCKAIGLAAGTSIYKGKTTHLLVPDTYYTSRRLGVAQAWGIKVVFPSWLKQLVESSPAVAAAPIVPLLQNVGRFVQPAPPQPAYNLDIDMLDCSTAPEPTDNQDEGIEKQLQLESSEVGPLKGCVICIYSKVENRYQLSQNAEKLGARLAYSLTEESKATHFILQSKRTKEPIKEFKIAVEKKMHIVHPQWLLDCAKEGIRVPEQLYKHTMDDKRSLQLSLGSSSSGSATCSSFSSDKVSGYKTQLRAASHPAGNHTSPQRYSTPLSFRAMPASPSRNPPHHRSSSATPLSPRNLSPHRELRAAASESAVASTRLDDSGFLHSGEKADMPKDRSPLTTSPRTSPNLSTRASTSTLTGGEAASAVSIGSDNAPSDQFLTARPVSSTCSVPTSTSISRELLAEMDLLMQANNNTPTPQALHHLNARMPYQQQNMSTPNLSGATSGSRKQRVFKRSAGPSANGGGGLSKASPSIGGLSLLGQGLLSRREGGCDALFDSQLHGPSGLLDSQDVTMQAESITTVRFNDPLAEATKNALLAGLRKAQQARAENAAHAADDEETIQSTRH